MWTKHNFPYFKRLEPSLSTCPSSTQEVTNVQYNNDALHYILEDVLDIDINNKTIKTFISRGTTPVIELLQINIEDINNSRYSNEKSGMANI